MYKLILFVTIVVRIATPRKAYVGFDNCYKDTTTATQYGFGVDKSRDITAKALTKENYVENYVYKHKLLNLDNHKSVDASNWEIDDGKLLSIPKYGLPPGIYKLTISIVQIHAEGNVIPPENPFSNNEEVCYFHVKPLPPVVVITGGRKRAIPDNVDLILDGTESYDQNVQKHSYKNLKFRWTCKQKLQPPTFCKTSPASTAPSFVVEHQLVVHDDEFEVVLEVTSPFGSKASATQIVVVSETSAVLEISCSKNCPPVSAISNYKRETLLSVKCVKQCEGVINEDYEWSIAPAEKGSEFSFDYEKDTGFGKKGHKFKIKRDVLKPGGYVVVVRAGGETESKGQARITLSYPKPPDVKDCKIDPTSGDNINTRFRLSCKQEPPNHPYLYELYKREASDPPVEELLVQGYYPDILQKSFLLPTSHGRKFVLRVLEEKVPHTEIQLNANVVSALANKSPEETIDSIKDLYNGVPGEDSVAKLMNSKDAEEREKGFQLFQALADEIASNKNKDQNYNEFIDNLKFEAAKDVLTTPLTTPSQILSLGEALAKLSSAGTKNSFDPLRSKYLTTACKKLGESYTEMAKNEQYPLNQADKSTKMSSALTKCMELNNVPKDDFVVPIVLNVTTEASIFDGPLLTENYANYVDHQESYYKNLEDLKEATFNSISTAAAAAKALALTTAVGEGLVETFGEAIATVVEKDKGEYLSKARIRCQGVVLVPSEDFAGKEHSFDILMTTWKTDILWWNPSFVQVATDIVSLEFWHSTCKERIMNFTKPAKIFFDIKKKNTSEESDYSFDVPEGYESLSDEDLNYKITVFRVLLPREGTLRVKFYEISEPLDVVLTVNEFPSTRDFANSTFVSSDFDFFLPAQNNYSVFGYVGLLANKQHRGTNQTKYRISFSSSSCIRWSMLDTKWVPTCQPGKENNATVISCECTHFSVIAGHVESVMFLRQEVQKPELELTLQVCYVIFVTVVITVALYCLLMVLVLTRKASVVYYLADNVRTHCFAYLLVVKTGLNCRSGTTSNVTIRLTGDKASSTPHVLNYPDPQLRMLQNFGNDVFLLATEQHLGNVLRVELWLDFVGNSPAWYCRDIIVYDMQGRSKWQFCVEKRFSMIKGPNYLEVQSCTKPTSSTKSFKFQYRYHTWIFWQHEDNFSYVDKLTTILSNILMTYMMALMCYAMPSFHLKDGFDTDSYDFTAYAVFVAFVSSFPSFMLHIVIAWCFRLSSPQFSRYKDTQKYSFKVALACWVVLIALITTSITFLIVCGFWVPYNKSLIWLTSCGVGLVFGVLIYEGVFIFLQNIFFRFELKLVQTIDKRFHEICEMVEQQRWFLYKKFGDLLLRPYFQHLYEPLEKHSLQEKQMILRRRRHIITELEDLVMFTIYVIILYVVILADKDSLVVRGKTAMEEMMRGVHTSSISFEDLEHVEHIFDYFNYTLIPAIHPNRWYGKYVISSSALMIDMNNKYIGVVRVRQQRIKRDTCLYPKILHFINQTCDPELYHRYKERRTFGAMWQPYQSHMQFDRLNYIWKYRSEKETNTFRTKGEFATYSGGGYLLYLGRTLYNTLLNFQNMMTKVWIDVDTRVIFVEFLTYNANYNYFSSVRLTVEQSATGYTHKLIRVNAVRMIIGQKKLEVISITFFVLFVVWVLVLLVKKALGVIVNIRVFYKDIWLMIDLFIILMSITCIVLFAVRVQMVGKYLGVLEKVKHNEFVGYFHLFYIEDYLTFVAGFLVCIATIRLWKFLRFGRMFQIVEVTLSIVGVTFLSIFFVYLVWLMSCAMASLLLLGNHFDRIHSYVRLVRLMVTAALRPVEFGLRSFTNYKTAMFFLIVYVIVMKFMFFVFAIIVVRAYIESQIEMSNDPRVYTIKHYIQEQMKYLPKYLRYKFKRLRGAGAFRERKVLPKSDKFIYSDCCAVSSRRMKSMGCITQCLIRNMTHQKEAKLTQRDFQLMLGVSRQYLRQYQSQNEVEVFYKGRVQDQRIKFIDEKQVDKMAHLVDLMLQDYETHVLLAEQKRDMFILDQCLQLINRNQEKLKTCDYLLHLAFHKIQLVELELVEEIES